MLDERRQLRALRRQLMLALHDIRKALRAIESVAERSIDCGILEDMIDELSGDSTHENFLEEFGSMLLALSISCDRVCDAIDWNDDIHGSVVPTHLRIREVPPDPA